MKNQAEDLVSEIRRTRLDKLHPGKGAVSHSQMEVFVFAARPVEAFTQICSIKPSRLSAASRYRRIRPKVPVYHPFVLFPVVNKHQSITPSHEWFLSPGGIQPWCSWLLNLIIFTISFRAEMTGLFPFFLSRSSYIFHNYQFINLYYINYNCETREAHLKKVSSRGKKMENIPNEKLFKRFMDSWARVFQT